MKKQVWELSDSTINKKINEMVSLQFNNGGVFFFCYNSPLGGGVMEKGIVASNEREAKKLMKKWFFMQWKTLECLIWRS